MEEKKRARGGLKLFALKVILFIANHFVRSYRRREQLAKDLRLLGNSMILLGFGVIGLAGKIPEVAIELSDTNAILLVIGGILFNLVALAVLPENEKQQDT